MLPTTTPRYTETFAAGYALVTCQLGNQSLHTARVPGLTKKAMAEARRQCKARVKYLLTQARP